MAAQLIRHEPVLPSRRPDVQSHRDDLLARAGLPRQEHGQIARREALDEREQALHRGVGRHDVALPEPDRRGRLPVPDEAISPRATGRVARTGQQGVGGAAVGGTKRQPRARPRRDALERGQDPPHRDVRCLRGLGQDRDEPSGAIPASHVDDPQRAVHGIDDGASVAHLVAQVDRDDGQRPLVAQGALGLHHQALAQLTVPEHGRATRSVVLPVKDEGGRADADRVAGDEWARTGEGLAVHHRRRLAGEILDGHLLATNDEPCMHRGDPFITQPDVGILGASDQDGRPRGEDMKRRRTLFDDHQVRRVDRTVRGSPRLEGPGRPAARRGEGGRRRRHRAWRQRRSLGDVLA